MGHKDVFMVFSECAGLWDVFSLPTILWLNAKQLLTESALVVKTPMGFVVHVYCGHVQALLPKNIQKPYFMAAVPFRVLRNHGNTRGA